MYVHSRLPVPLHQQQGRLMAGGQCWPLCRPAQTLETVPGPESPSRYPHAARGEGWEAVLLVGPKQDTLWPPVITGALRAREAMSGFGHNAMKNVFGKPLCLHGPIPVKIREVYHSPSISTLNLSLLESNSPGRENDESKLIPST